jgi:hypothetical protein
MSAASVGNVELLHLLLDAAGDAAQGLLMLCNIGGWSCVHASVKHWHVPMLRALLPNHHDRGIMLEPTHYGVCVCFITDKRLSWATATRSP